MHYVARYKKRILFLEQKIRDYYMANYEAKRAIDLNPGVTVLYGDEESLITLDIDGMRKIIEGLPLLDCGS
jgi:hypothetical protein